MMTLTEIRYVVALAHEKHFGRAASRCFVSQPTLSLAIKKVESRMNAALFERMADGVSLTPFGQRFLPQAERVLEEALHLKELAQMASDPLLGPLRIGVIYSVAPYLLPPLVSALHQSAPQMPLFLKEDFTQQLIFDLKSDAIDIAILALPINEPGLVTKALYEEDFCVIAPRDHAFAKHKKITREMLDEAPVLLLGQGNCFRDQVLESCPNLKKGAQPLSGIEGNSLETLRYMVESGVGVAIFPVGALNPKMQKNDLICSIPFDNPTPHRTIALVWRVSFPRNQTIDVLQSAILSCALFGVRPLIKNA